MLTGDRAVGELEIDWVVAVFLLLLAVLFLCAPDEEHGFLDIFFPVGCSEDCVAHLWEVAEIHRGG
jgi:hypothetical protein